MTVGVYSITEIRTGRRYIGKSVNIEKRWADHKYGVTNRFLKKLAAEFGWNAFRFEILESFASLNERVLSERETFWIGRFQTCDRRFGFNLSTDSSGVARLHDETKVKISESLRGRPVSDETRKKIAESLRGRHQSPEVRVKLSLAASNPSPEVRAKMSAAAKARFARERAANGGVIHRAEITKAKISKANRNRTPEHKEKLLFYIRNRGPETRKKLSIAATLQHARKRALKQWIIAP